ncbi:EamA family transporter, partial [Bacillus spizizenii]|uniref:EamA family transporter n=1 Tax=Bacillus spizizenii TaxID=96241 RepID=UPI001F60475D
LLAFLVILWGIIWPLSKAELAYSPRLLFAGIRTLICGLLLVIVALPRIHKLRLKETRPIYLISALLYITLFYGLQTIGLNYLPA